MLSYKYVEQTNGRISQEPHSPEISIVKKSHNLSHHHLERVQGGLDRAVGQIHNHPQPVHLIDDSLNRNKVRLRLELLRVEERLGQFILCRGRKSWSGEKITKKWNKTRSQRPSLGLVSFRPL